MLNGKIPEYKIGTCPEHERNNQGSWIHLFFRNFCKGYLLPAADRTHPTRLACKDLALEIHDTHERKLKQVSCAPENREKFQELQAQGNLSECHIDIGMSLQPATLFQSQATVDIHAKSKLTPRYLKKNPANTKLHDVTEFQILYVSAMEAKFKILPSVMGSPFERQVVRKFTNQTSLL